VPLIADPWLAKVGPFGLSYRGVLSIRGFRRLRWRIWRRLPGDPLALSVEALLDPDVTVRPPDLPVMHFAAGPFQPPLCSPATPGPTTVEYDVMLEALADPEAQARLGWRPCAECMERAIPIMIQYRATSR
jgi:hypothetical protein